MLQCKIDIRALTPTDIACGNCNICVARSKLNYPFDQNLVSSNTLVHELTSYIESNTEYKCRRTTIDKNPDIAVIAHRDRRILICRIEAKMLGGYAFMKAEKLLGDHLKPKETLVVDLPKLLHYFRCKEIDKQQQGRDIPIFIVWKFDRPCEKFSGISVFQEVTALKAIYDQRGNARQFTRRSTPSDIKNGARMGVIEKYHFSIKECRPIEELINAIRLCH